MDVEKSVIETCSIGGVIVLHDSNGEPIRGRLEKVKGTCSFDYNSNKIFATNSNIPEIQLTINGRKYSSGGYQEHVIIKRGFIDYPLLAIYHSKPGFNTLSFLS